MGTWPTRLFGNAMAISRWLMAQTVPRTSEPLTSRYSKLVGCTTRGTLSNAAVP